MVNLYLQSGCREGQQGFIQQHVARLLGRSAIQIWGGDYNFVECPALDRLSAGVADVGTATEWHAAAPQLTDQFRRLHPTSRAYSRVAHGSASRIDRFYATPNLTCYIPSCSIGSGTGFSDHRPATLTLSAKRPTQGPGLYRTRLYFTKDPQLRSAFGIWLGVHISQLPSDRAELLEAWPEFKRHVAAECGQMNRLHRQRRTSLSLIHI